MFNNGLNRDTVYYVGLDDKEWLSASEICDAVNNAGYALTDKQTKTLLNALVREGKVIKYTEFDQTGKRNQFFIKLKS